MHSRIFAAYSHKIEDLKYGDEEYVVHLDEVNDIIKKFGYNIDYINIPFANFQTFVRQATYLHDIIEDTNHTYESISLYFHIIVAKSTQNISDVRGKNRKKTKKLTNEKLSKLSVLKTDELIALIIKPADRLANMRRSLKERNRIFKTYYKEYKDFRKAVYRDKVADAIWLELDKLYEEYKAIID